MILYWVVLCLFSAIDGMQKYVDPVVKDLGLVDNQSVQSKPSKRVKHKKMKLNEFLEEHSVGGLLGVQEPRIDKEFVKVKQPKKQKQPIKFAFEEDEMLKEVKQVDAYVYKQELGKFLYALKDLPYCILQNIVSFTYKPEDLQFLLYVRQTTDKKCRFERLLVDLLDEKMKKIILSSMGIFKDANVNYRLLMEYFKEINRYHAGWRSKHLPCVKFSQHDKSMHFLQRVACGEVACSCKINSRTDESIWSICDRSSRVENADKRNNGIVRISEIFFTLVSKDCNYIIHEQEIKSQISIIQEQQDEARRLAVQVEQAAFDTIQEQERKDWFYRLEQTGADSFVEHNKRKKTPHYPRAPQESISIVREVKVKDSDKVVKKLSRQQKRETVKKYCEYMSKR